MQLLAELKAALEAATPGEWDYGTRLTTENIAFSEVRTKDSEDVLFRSVQPAHEHNANNAELIALMKNNLPALIECAEALGELRNSLNEPDDLWSESAYARACRALDKLRPTT